MNNKQIEMPKKKEKHSEECNLWHDIGGIPRHINREGFEWKCNCGFDSYNLCHDEFTAWLVERMEELEGEIYGELKRQYKGKRLPTKVKIKDLATAIKTMILGGER